MARRPPPKTPEERLARLEALLDSYKSVLAVAEYRVKMTQKLIDAAKYQMRVTAHEQ